MNLTPFFESFESHTIVTLKDDQGRAWVCGRSLSEPTGMDRVTIRRHIQELSAEDKAVHFVNTPGGPQKMTFISESGALQIIVQSRKPEARRLRKWVCDLAVRYAKGELTEAGNFVTADQLHAAITAAVTPLAEIVQQLAGVVQVLADRNPALRPVRLGSRPQQDLEVWSVAQHRRMRKTYYITGTEVLTFKTGKNPTATESGGFTSRVLAYCRAHGLKPKHFYHHGRTKTYLPQLAAEQVYRTGWTSKTQALSEAQGDLFDELNQTPDAPEPEPDAPESEDV